jgi:hypothetical protein
MPHSTRDVGHVVICCRVPEGLSLQEADRWRNEASVRGIRVTWCVAPGGVRDWLEHDPSCGDVAVRLPAPSTGGRMDPQTVRSGLETVAGRVSSAVVDGDQPLDHRRLFRDAGIQVVAVESLHPVSRQSRRPPPAGWECRCLLWGLWEVGFTGPQPRLFGLLKDHRPKAGRLTVVETGCREDEDPRSGFTRLRDTMGYFYPLFRQPQIRSCLLSDLPAGLQRNRAADERGSILAAADAGEFRGSSGPLPLSDAPRQVDKDA